MGYSLHFESELGRGTTVEISFSAPVVHTPRSVRCFDEIRLIGLKSLSSLDLSHLPEIAAQRWDIPVVEEEFEDGSWGGDRSLCIVFW